MVRVFLSMQQSKPDVQSFEERIALLEKAFANLTLQCEVGEGGAQDEWTSDCEAPDGNSIVEFSSDSFDASASEYDYSGDEFDDDRIPSSSAPAEERHKPVFGHRLLFHLPDYDTEVARPPHYEKLYFPMLKAGGCAPAAGEGAGFSGPEYDPECGLSMIPLAHWAKLAAAISRLQRRSLAHWAKLAAAISRLGGVLRRAKLAA